MVSVHIVNNCMTMLDILSSTEKHKSTHQKPLVYAFWAWPAERCIVFNSFLLTYTLLLSLWPLVFMTHLLWPILKPLSRWSVRLNWKYMTFQKRTWTYHVVSFFVVVGHFFALEKENNLNMIQREKDTGVSLRDVVLLVAHVWLMFRISAVSLAFV